MFTVSSAILPIAARFPLGITIEHGFDDDVAAVGTWLETEYDPDPIFDPAHRFGRETAQPPDQTVRIG